MGYVTVQEYKDYMAAMLNRASTQVPRGDDDTFLQQLIESATEFIESETKRKFSAFADVRLYDTRAIVWNDRQLLLLDQELLSVTTLTNGNGQVIPNDGYYLEPLNKEPAFGIRLRSNYVWSFDTDGRVSVNGMWGRMTTPNNDVKRVTCRLAYIFMKRREATGDVEVIGTGAQVGGTLRYGSYLPSDVRDWLKRHTRQVYGNR